MTTIIAVVGDTHCGGTTGLCPPIYELNGNGHKQANKAQKWLWRCWVDYWRRVFDLASEYSAEIITVVNGDLVEGVHHGTTQVVSLRPDDMMNIAIACLEPYTRRAKHLFVTKGTEAHVGSGGLWDDLLARDLGAIPHDASPAWYWLPIEVEGVKFTFSHHGRAGTRGWTKGTGARTIAADLSMQSVRTGRPVPNVAVFGHVHRFEDSGNNYPVWVQTHGCWQLSTAYGHKISPGIPPDIGGLCFIVDNGRIVSRDPIIRYQPREEDPWIFTSTRRD
jgi:hypothetical protein